MSQKEQKRSNGVNAVLTKSFSRMSGAEKVKHIGKVIVFILSFGFAFPNVFSD